MVSGDGSNHWLGTPTATLMIIGDPIRTSVEFKVKFTFLAIVVNCEAQTLVICSSFDASFRMATKQSWARYSIIGSALALLRYSGHG